jgi:hypothetical protein
VAQIEAKSADRLCRRRELKPSVADTTRTLAEDRVPASTVDIRADEGNSANARHGGPVRPVYEIAEDDASVDAWVDSIISRSKTR